MTLRDALRRCGYGRLCAVCGEWFGPRSSSEIVCSRECAQELRLREAAQSQAQARWRTGGDDE